MRRLNTLLVAGMCFAVLAGDAAAWGPNARKAITRAALQVIRQDFYDSFRAEVSNYEQDLYRGAEDGYGVVRESIPISSDSQAIIAVSHEIQLLRTVREDGTGSYFAYRMGALSALVADAILPHGVEYASSEQDGGDLKIKIDTDLEDQLASLRAVRTARSNVYLRNVPEYFRERRLFFADDSKMIRDDYDRGLGGDGFLAQAAQDYLSRSVEAVVNAWYTVFVDRASTNDTASSAPILSEYSVNEIAYLLDMKGNMEQANRAYRVFARVNQGRGESYEVVGDLYYNFGDESKTPDAKERGVSEWQLARRIQGPQRKSAALKLARHYESVGDAALRRAAGPDATDADLEEALLAFQKALECDRASNYAADMISETKSQVASRRKDYNMQSSALAKSREVSQEAERKWSQKAFATAMDVYKSARNLLDSLVNNRFPDLAATAESERKGIQKSIRDIIDEVLDTADALVDDGDTALIENRFDTAVAAYGKVPALLQGIYVKPGSLDEEAIRNQIDSAKEKITDAERARKLFQSQPPAVGPGSPARLGGAPPGPRGPGPGGPGG